MKYRKYERERAEMLKIDEKTALLDEVKDGRFDVYERTSVSIHHQKRSRLMVSTDNLDNIAVSVICSVYNHENYIRQTIESLLNQKTSFNYEIIVHDDASTDNSGILIQEFVKKYPKKIKAICQRENKYSQGIHIGEKFIYPICKGKYIALCEGDDYWTDPYKIQKQYDILEKHLEIDMCAHSADVIDARSGKRMNPISPSQVECILSTEEVIMGGGGFLATNSLFFRREIVTIIPPFREKYKIDYTIQINGALRGGIYFLPEVMSVYRYMTPGSWGERTLKNKANVLENCDKIVEMLNLLDMYTKGIYSEIIKKTIIQHKFSANCLVCEERKLLCNEYKEYRQSLPYKQKILFYVGIISPKLKKWLIQLNEKIKHGI